MRGRGVLSLLVLAGLCCAIAGCESGGGTTAISVGDAGDAKQPPAAGSSASATPIDVCSLLSADDVAPLLQAPVAGHPFGTVSCTWKNPSTYESVAVEIGSPGTAVNNTLPPVEPGFPDAGPPGPDGMRFLATGIVEFPAAGRSNTVQVAAPRMSGDEANSAALALARKVAPQIRS
jgi:hypothetical protein